MSVVLVISPNGFLFKVGLHALLLASLHALLFGVGLHDLLVGRICAIRDGHIKSVNIARTLTVFNDCVVRKLIVIITTVFLRRAPAVYRASWSFQ